MYCPKCSQQQVSDETSFCSRCGFPLGSVRELVVSNGVSAENEVGASEVQLSQSERGMRKGGFIMLAGFALLLIVGLLTAINDVFAVILLIPVLCFIAGFARLFYGMFLEKRTSFSKGDASEPQTSAIPAQLDSNARNPQLSPSGFIPIEDFNTQRMMAAKIVQLPSVTENTTKLLDEEA